MQNPPPNTRTSKDLINKDYYDDIKAGLPERPTVRDEIKAMMARGNARYVENWSGYKPTAHERKFTPNRTTHEITHLCARIPHSMQGEMSGLYFEWGLANGLGLLNLEVEEARKFAKDLEDATESYMDYSTNYHTHLPERASKRSAAIHFAAGLYLREKMEQFVAQGYPQKSYEAQHAFCEAYADTDHAADSAQAAPVSIFSYPGELDHEGKLMDVCQHAPNTLIHLSAKEWRAIEAVALGMCEPEQTAYAGRLRPIKETLQHIGVYFDRPKFVEQLRAGKISKEQSAGLGKSDAVPPR